ncbi:C4-dicarboxylate TRAP transporter substrate-binding protein [Flavimaricola marinus]|uniref:Bacterial extracellular solute-binding protein, family 7 n=1 Tax=Flavimaricola marinus TaxID=1819565 RepID=A0A238LEL0_9RHOB|nr:C4-dicarboxylate TRAP transporter substrate-binding protein [Flavimaricola marinus]SMY08048.1 Bacterial extracellular solute-binding protein, family 7 [Flavimaricola marinus]
MNTFLKGTVGLAVLAGAVGAAMPAIADTFTLRIGSGHPNGPAIYVTDTANFFVPEVVRRVAEETEHEIEFVEGYGGAIAGVAETLEAVQNGILDIGAYCMCFEPAKLFLHNFPYYAPFGPGDSAANVANVRAVYDQVPWLTEQFSAEYDQQLLGLHGWDNYHLGTTNPWATVADLQGVKIGGAGPNLPWLEFAGAIPVQSTLPDGYMSLQTGVYDGWLMFPSAYLGFKFYEPSPYYTLIGFGPMAVNALTINTRSMERLPEDVQAIIREVGAAYEAQAGESLNAAQARGLTGLTEAGATVTTLGDDVRAEWAESLVSFPNQQAKDADGRGMPGTEVMNAYLAAVTASGYEWPVDYAID